MDDSIIFYTMTQGLDLSMNVMFSVPCSLNVINLWFSALCFMILRAVLYDTARCLLAGVFP